MTATSQTDPLRIAEVEVAAGLGKIGFTFAPGKHDAGRAPRDLGADLAAIAAWPARALVTLIEPHEFELLEIRNLGAAARRRGLDWRHLPIRDFGAPSPAFDAAWPAESAVLRARLAKGENIVVHCRGGLGRSGMIAARLLVDNGIDADSAISRVRVARPGAIETLAQEDWVRGRHRS